MGITSVVVVAAAFNNKTLKKQRLRGRASISITSNTKIKNLQQQHTNGGIKQERRHKCTCVTPRNKAKNRHARAAARINSAQRHQIPHGAQMSWPRTAQFSSKQATVDDSN
eukprot:8207089-Alexandrium_andersonii.AAC.1